MFIYSFLVQKLQPDSSGKDCLKALQFVRYNLTLAAVQSCISAENSGGDFARCKKSAKASAVWRRVITTEAQPVWLEKIVVVICSTVQ